MVNTANTPQNRETVKIRVLQEMLAIIPPDREIPDELAVPVIDALVLNMPPVRQERYLENGSHLEQRQLSSRLHF
jgi:hypothetical protein